MNEFLEIIHITLRSISKAVYNYWFLLVVIILYFLIKKIYILNIYNFENGKPPIWSLVESIIQGIVVGLVGSLVVIGLGVPIQLTGYVFYLLPISLLLSMFKIRYLCMSYSAAIIGALSLILNGQMFINWKLPNIDINIPSLIALVGILHLMESILVYFVGADDCMPIICEKDGKIIQGHILQKYWPIPFAILLITLESGSGNIVQMPSWWPLLKTNSQLMKNGFFGIMPIIGVLGYRSVSFTEQPEKRAKKTGIMLFSYSILMILFAMFAKTHRILHIIGLLLMAAVHETIILLEQNHEKDNKPIYTLPNQGIRIMYVMEGGVAEKIGMKKGEVIKKINNFEVINAKHYKELMANKWVFMWIESEDFNKQVHTYEIKTYPNGLDDLGIKILPEKPRILFQCESIKGK